MSNNVVYSDYLQNFQLFLVSTLRPEAYFRFFTRYSVPSKELGRGSCTQISTSGAIRVEEM